MPEHRLICPISKNSSPDAHGRLLDGIASTIKVLGEKFPAANGVGTFFSTLFYANGAGGYEINQKIDINAPNAPGLTAAITGNSDSFGRVLTITDSSGAQKTFGLLPTGTANQYQLVFASDENNNPVTADQFSNLAAYLSAYTTVNVVYNQKSGSGTGKSGSVSGGSSAATGSPDPDDEEKARQEYEDYKDELRQQMQRPSAQDADLNKILDKIYRPNAQVGSGSTADAVRYEMSTGQPVGGVFHTQKAQEMVTSLNNWLARNPTATGGDRAAAENVIKDLVNALNGK